MTWSPGARRCGCPLAWCLRGRQSGIEVDRVWQYVFTTRDGKLLRQDGYDDRGRGAARPPASTDAQPDAHRGDRRGRRRAAT